jgi:hypothetical protein
MPKQHSLAPTPDTVHWGYLDAEIPPRLNPMTMTTVMFAAVVRPLHDDAGSRHRHLGRLRRARADISRR